MKETEACIRTTTPSVWHSILIFGFMQFIVFRAFPNENFLIHNRNTVTKKYKLAETLKIRAYFT